MEIKLLKNCSLVSSSGGKLHFHDDEGEVQFSAFVPAGNHRGAEFVKYSRGCGECSFENVEAFLAQPNVRPQPYGEGAFETGANPDFKVTSATRAERFLQQQMAGLAAKSRSVDAKLAAIMKAADMRDNAVVEATEPPAAPDPDPAPEAAPVADPAPEKEGAD